jgi:hypothetical protein
VYRPLAIWSLCLLVVVGSTTASVSHDHALGWRPHTHGFGVVALSTGPNRIAGCRQEGARHRHFILFGVEVYQADSSSDTRGDGPDAASGLPHLGLGDCVAQDSWPAPAPDGAAAWAVWLLALQTPSFTDARALETPPACSDTDPAHGHSVCDAARGERSGVLIA